MTTTTQHETDAPALDVEGWRELGRSIARRMAQAYRAEWKWFTTDDLTESDKEFEQYRKAQLEPLWNSESSLANDEYYWLRDACVDAWRGELAKELRMKRGSRSRDDVWSDRDPFRAVHLLLADGTTITGGIRSDGKHFIFRTGQYSEAEIELPENAEFMVTAALLPQAIWYSSPLYLQRESGGFRHYLARRPVHCGSGLTMMLPCGQAIDGRYECNLSRQDCMPVFYFSLAGGIGGTERNIKVPSDVQFKTEERR
jgi:hypothetical protein